ncbi:glycosyltransferase family 2 protein [Waterburya agarophytonicola K14]|uniref:Glycosyltransferase family 2 protein n=1 Tax=Waterburya agarophytonicola KI4 TaxID=2874699 RepID=A0A964FG34_9CYAN|nr:glycosyltransferase family 2 protein [Waterburya agarophytonicola]MCC0177747.1 glycosyltransferase family 2 protein [Waterburya agarophytonicola KI4]
MMSTPERPLVSVIIPTYKRGELVSRAINSVLEQSYQNLEIIVVDDHSQDNTADVVGEIEDDRLRYYCHSTNQGGSAARNTGIKLARGQYIAFLDSDDVWLPQKLTIQLQAIANRAVNRDWAVSYTKFQKSSTVFYQPSVLPRRGKKPQETIADYFWLGDGETLTSTLLVSRSLAVAHLFQTNLRKHQDLDFVLNLDFQGAEFIFVPQPLTIWHNEYRSDRISRLNDYQLSLDWIEAYRGKISERSYQGFLLKEVVPKMLRDEKTKPRGIKLLKEGFFQRTISINFLLFLMLQQVVPKQYQNYVKILFSRIKLIKNI